MRSYQAERGPKRILLPVDFARSSKEALERAIGVAGQSHASVTILFVVDFNHYTPAIGPVNWTKTRDELTTKGQTEFLEIQQCYGSGVALDFAIESGFAHEVIPQYAVEHNHDLIIIGKRPHRWWQQLFRRHTAERVLENSTVPVIVIDSARHQREELGDKGFQKLNVCKT